MFMETRIPIWAVRLPVALFIALGAWALVSCQEDASAAPEGGQPEVSSDRSLTFAWPIPSDVEVTEEHTEPLQRVIAKYSVELRETATAGKYVVRRRNYRLVEVNGLEASDPTLRPMVAPLMVSRGIVPDIFIDAQGQVVDVEQWDSYTDRVDQMLKFLAREESISELHAENTLAQMRAPGVEAGVRSRAMEFWVLWVNGWLDNDFTESAELIIYGDFPLQGGGVLSFPQQLRHNGPEVGMEGYVRLSMESHLSGDEVTKAIAAAMGSRGAMAPVTSAETTNKIWVIMRPETMQPVEAESENRRIVTTAAGDQEYIDLMRYVFDWR